MRKADEENNENWRGKKYRVMEDCRKGVRRLVKREIMECEGKEMRNIMKTGGAKRVRTGK